MIKKSFRLMLLVAFALSSVMFVACNKYDDDIERIDNEIASLQATVQSLKAAVDGGAVISSVSNTAEGVKFTLSNGQSYVVNHGTNGANGADGAAGAAGKDGSVVTIGENGNWFIDGEDTGKTAKGQGEPGKSPRINEAGNWEVWNPETEAWDDTKVSAAGAQTYVVDCGSYYELNVMEQVDGVNAGFTAIKLPKTTPITSIEVVSPAQGTDIVLNYGAPLGDDIKFNGVTYAEGTNLIPVGSSLKALVNPVNTDASVFNFALMDSHGNKPYVITWKSKWSQNNPLTKAAHIGYWNMGVALAEGLTFQDYATAVYPSKRSERLYALATETANGLVASKYTVTVEENKVDEITDINLNNLKKSVSSSINLVNAFNDYNDVYNSTGVVEDNTAVAEVDDTPVSDLDSYMIDCYFKIADATVAETYGLKLDGNTLTAEKPVPANTAKIYAYYLLADGTEVDAADDDTPSEFYVEFTYATPGADALNVEWTITNSTRTDDGVENGIRTGRQHVFLSLASIQNALKGAVDTDIPTFTADQGEDWLPYGKSYHMDNYTYEANGQIYGYGAANNLPEGVTEDDDYIFAGNENSWIATIDESTLYYKSSSNGYFYKTNGETKIQTNLYVKFTFDYKEAFPGEYQTTLYFQKGNRASDDATIDLAVPVKVTIKSPAESDINPFQRKDAYFSGDNAVAYGTATGGYAYYNMFDLFKDMDGEEDNVYFVKEKTGHTHSGSCGSWFNFGDDNENNGEIKVRAYNEEYSATSSTNRERVYSTREITAKYVVYGNTHIPYVYDTFNLTIKSEIHEGTLTTGSVSASGTGVDPIKVSLKNITAKDVYGRTYDLAPTYKYCEEHKTYDLPNATAADSRLSDVSIVLVDDNAKAYLKVSDFDGKTFTNAFDGYSAFGVQRDFSKGQAALTKDVECTVAVQVTDNWGRITSTNVKVTLKK